MNRKLSKKYLLILLMPLGYLLNRLSMGNSAMTEKYYTGGIFKAISWLVGNLLGWIPFSVAELLLPAMGLLILWRLIVLAVRMGKNKKDRWIFLRNFVLNVVLAVSLVYFSFLSMWGFNYNRQSLAVITGLEVRPSSTEELIQLTDALLEDTNSLRQGVAVNEAGVMVPFGGAQGGFERAKEGYAAASAYFPELKGVRSQPKPLLFSPVIAYTNIWGIYSPFTVESNVNMKIPTPMLLSTMTHEMAHQLGFAREDEANYLAYLACSLHPDVDFQYAGALFALSYSMGAVYQNDKDAYRDIYARLDEGVKRDLAENRKYSEKYDGPVEEAFSKSNDAYLKANNQKDGERSYGRMVDLLLAQYRHEKETGK
jgi:small basic protein